MRTLNYYTAFSTTHTFLGLVLTVFLLSFFVSVTIEASFLNLEKLIFAPLTTKKTDSATRKTANEEQAESAHSVGQDNAAIIKAY